MPQMALRVFVEERMWETASERVRKQYEPWYSLSRAHVGDHSINIVCIESLWIRILDIAVTVNEL
jgi:hypothetical protein